MNKERLNIFRDYPNYVIFALGFVCFVAFYVWAKATTGLNSSLLVNLAAGSLIISVTVLVVDAVRSKQQRLSLRGAAIDGVSKIQMANIDAITMLGDHHFHDLDNLQDQLLDNLFTKKLKRMPNKTYVDDYMKRLLELNHGQLLDGLSTDQLSKLRKILTKAMEVCDTTLYAYSYAFNNKLRGHLLNFRETIVYALYTLSDSNLAKENGLQRASSMFSVYIEQYQVFQNMKKY